MTEAVGSDFAVYGDSHSGSGVSAGEVGVVEEFDAVQIAGEKGFEGLDGEKVFVLDKVGIDYKFVGGNGRIQKGFEGI